MLREEGVEVDQTKIVALGYSAGATLALCLVSTIAVNVLQRFAESSKGGEIDPPVAILDFYGPKYFRDEFWSSSLSALSKLPEFETTFTNKIFDEEILTSTTAALERSNKPVLDEVKPKKGMPPPDLSQPRNAWLFGALKDGTHLAKIVQDDDYDRIDPVNLFSSNFPPTFFIHGLEDNLVIPEFSKRASRALRALGVETELAIVPGASHGFDIGLEFEEPQYEYIRRAIEFLKKSV